MSPSTKVPSEPLDLALLRRVQEENQREIIGKLLHDLRNPVHSLRITLELFGRLGRREGDLNKLVERAATYAGPAEAALNGLLAVNQRLGVYLSNPTTPVPAPLAVDEWLDEIATLLRSSPRRLQVALERDGEGPVGRVIADRPRASHAILRHCFSSAVSHVSLTVHANGADSVCIGISAPTKSADQPVADRADTTVEAAGRFGMDELQLLITNAGGAVIDGTAGGIRLSFPRSAD